MRFNRYRVGAVGLILLFAIGGLLALRQSGAAGFMMRSEAESGTPAGNAAIITDGQSSGGQAVRFGAVGGQPGVPARTTEAFIDSIGIGTHTYYYSYRNYNAWRDKLANSGIRHIRELLQPGSTDQVDRINELHAIAGIKASVIIDLRPDRGGPVPDMIRWLKDNYGPAIQQVEGPNEYENSNDPVFGSPDDNWATLGPLARQFQRDLYAQVKADPALKHLPVLGPSIAISDDYQMWGDLKDHLDYGNIHPYPGGRPPSANLQEWLDDARIVSGGKPVQATESGYHNDVTTDSGHRPASERASGIYIPRMYLEYFRQGVVRTYPYELLNEDDLADDIEGHFGFLRADFSEKPAFTATKNLIAILEDPGATFTAGSLNYSVANAPADMRQVLLQKRDGTFYLALWRENSAYEQVAARDVDPANTTVTLQLTSPAASISRYMPNRGITALTTLSNVQSVPVEVSEEVTLLSITGASL